MGLKVKYLNFMFDSIYQAGYGSDYIRLRMCELGNQLMRYRGDPPLTKYVRKAASLDLKDVLPESGKQYFELLGFNHVSIDINGRNGALPLDLTKLIVDKDLVGQFDIVTNSGTSEHVADQYMVFRNISTLLKRGGIVIHLVPLKGGIFKRHGLYQYPISFFEGLIKSGDFSSVMPPAHRKTVPGFVTTCLRKVRETTLDKSFFNVLEQKKAK